jgi:hypothetical protein|tara:strand:- start:3719 stop:4129 length:411 start_codon:yes stop_codon:yes gene_type:complete
MGTRAIYIFEDENEEVWAYKHYDNYPRGAADFIENAKEFAWELPRFEADEFAAAFVAANKNRRGGEVRLVNALFKDRDEMLEANHWCDYHYVISKHNSQDLWVEIWQMRDTWNWVLIDELTHTEMKEKYGERAIAI